MSVKSNQDPMELIHTLFPDKRVEIMDIEAHKTDAECRESDVKLTILSTKFLFFLRYYEDLSSYPYVKHIDF